MGQHYYYLAASLPTLTPDQGCALSNDEFLHLCSQHVGPRDFRHLIDARIDDFSNQTANPVTASWRTFNMDVREQLLILRAPVLRWNTCDFSRSDKNITVLIKDEIRSIFEQNDPMKAESALFDLRWLFLDEIDRLYFMCLENLIVYSLKIQLIEGRKEMTPECGGATMTAIRQKFADQLPTWNQS